MKTIKFVAWVGSEPLLRGTTDFLILRDIYQISESGELIPFRTHFWVNLGKEKRLKKVMRHDIITFTGLIYEYEKADKSLNLGIEKIRYVEQVSRISGSGRNSEKVYKKLLNKIKG
jgi:aspartyl/asparaginyl-tRNA synthetase